MVCILMSYCQSDYWTCLKVLCSLCRVFIHHHTVLMIAFTCGRARRFTGVDFQHRPFSPRVPVGQCTAKGPWDLWLGRPPGTLVILVCLHVATKEHYSIKIDNFGLQKFPPPPPPPCLITLNKVFGVTESIGDLD